MKHDYHKIENELLHCEVCNGAEITLPSECPGKVMTEEEEKFVADGLIDFKDGKWTYFTIKRDWRVR